MNGFDENVIRSFSGHSPKILLMDAQDLLCVLEQRTSFFDLLKLKVDRLVRKGEIFVHYGT